MDVRSPSLMGVRFLQRLKKENFLRPAGETEWSSVVWNDTPGFLKSHFPSARPGRGAAGIQQRRASVQSLFPGGAGPGVASGYLQSISNRRCVRVLQAGNANRGQE